MLRAADPAPITALRNTYFDYLQRLAPREYVDLPVRVIDIDENSLRAQGQWPWPRDTVALLVERLFALGAASVAFDILFAEPDRHSLHRLVEDERFSSLIRDPGQLERLNNDQMLADAISERPVVLGVAAVTSAPPHSTPAKAGFVEIGAEPAKGLYGVVGFSPLVPVLQQAASGIGGINVAPGDSTGAVRRVPLIWSGPDGLLPGLGIEALRLALGETTYFVEGSNEIAGAVSAVEIGGYAVETTDQGAMWLHFRHDNAALYVSANDILDDSIWTTLAGRIDGNIVLVGTSAAGLLDIRTTALGEQVPGVSIHAQAIEQILLGAGLKRSDFVAGIEILAFVSLGLLVVAVMSISGAVASIFAGGIAAAIVVSASWFAFLNAGSLFDATFPTLGGLANFGLLAMYKFVLADREKRKIRRSFAHYVAPEVLEDIEQSGHALELGGELRDVTVMFADIRDFTPLSESVGPQELVALLNRLFTELGDEILRENGTIDKFIGDSIMAFWNAPMELPRHPRHAALAALAMRQGLNRFNTSAAQAGHPEIGLAIGCASGAACVGNIGSQSRFNYTVVGDTVNAAARFETSCRHVGYDIVFGHHPDIADLALLEAGLISLKGKSERARLYVLVGDRDVAETPEFVQLATAHKNLLQLAQTGAAIRRDTPQLVACRQLGIGIEPGLATFYDRLPDRLSDFQPHGMAAA